MLQVKQNPMKYKDENGDFQDCCMLLGSPTTVITQITPLFAETLDELNQYGDKTKVYVLPDGYVYAYITVTQNNAEVKQWANTGIRFVVSAIGTPIVGTIDDNNVITLDGDLEEGVYTVRYYNQSNYKDIGTLTIGAPDTTLSWSVGTKIDTSTGAESSSSTYAASNYIEVVSGYTYTLSRTKPYYDAKICYYDANKNFLSCTSSNLVSIANKETSATIPMISGASYFRLRCYASGAEVSLSESVASTTITATKG